MKIKPRENITKKVLDIGVKEANGGYVTEQDKMHLELHQSPVFLAQEINKELVELNTTADRLESSLSTLRWMLIVIVGLLFLIALKH